jgi:flagellar motor switch protein FliN
MPSPIEWISEQWAGLAGPALSALTGLQCRGEAETGTPPEDQDGLLHWRQAVDAAPGAAIHTAAGSAMWRRIGRLVLSAAGLDDAAEEEIRGTFLEALQQMLSPLGGVLGGRFGREVNLLPGEETGPAPGLDWTALTLTADGEILGQLHIAISPELAAGLDAASAPAAAGPEAGPPPQQQQQRPLAAPGGSSKTLDLLLEVELPVGVSFGRTQMRVKDAVKLTTGSIVELNRSVSAPVEIIVNNCVIARGEVVVVEGNYGVRIQEIISREERLRTLF